jgi:hypothetical protein
MLSSRSRPVAGSDLLVWFAGDTGARGIDGRAARIGIFSDAGAILASYDEFAVFA